MVDLLPCPGCGGTKIGGPYFDEREGMHYLSCISKVASCGWSVYGGTPDEASTRWNRRTPPPATAITREELEEMINRELRSYELYGGNILDAIATYHNDETVKEALETVADWSAWLADAILARLGETK